MMDDIELLRRYTVEASEDAFRALLERHAGLVYSAALRQVRDPHLAEEVTQAVFVVLARKAGALRPGTILAGWLFRTTRFVAARAIRDQQLRQRREGEAALMETAQHLPGAEASWDDLAPVLDEALARLGETDRHAVLLRFFERKQLKEVGHVLGSTEEAAKKRVSRALVKLRAFLVRRGVTLSATVLAGLLAESAVHAAPTAVTASSLAAVTANSGTVAMLSLVKSTLQWMFYARLKSGAVAIAIALLSLGTGFTTLTVLRESEVARYIPISLEQIDAPRLTEYAAGRLWGSLPVGTTNWGGVPFQISRKLHLHGNQDAQENRHYPARVTGIAVHEKLGRLHVIQAANIVDRDGQPEAALRLNYSDGSTHTLFIVYGAHTREWWQYPSEIVSSVSDTNTSVIWTGHSTEGDDQGAIHRVFRTSLNLPAGKPAVESIDCLSLFGRSSLFILAMTGEAPRKHRAGLVMPSANESLFRKSLSLNATTETGQPVAGVRVIASTMGSRGNPTRLGQFYNASSATMPVDLPLTARDVQLAVAAPGFLSTTVQVNSATGAGLANDLLVTLTPNEASRKDPTGLSAAEYQRAAAAAAEEGFFWKHSEDYGRAAVAFASCVQRFPDFAEGHDELACALRESGQAEAALPHHARAIQLEPERGEYYWQRGRTHMLMKNYAAAQWDFEKTLERLPRFAWAYRHLAESYQYRQDFAHALLNWNKAIAMETNNAVLYPGRANLHRLMGNDALARADLARAGELAKNEWRVAR